MSIKLEKLKKYSMHFKRLKNYLEKKEEIFSSLSELKFIHREAVYACA